MSRPALAPLTPGTRLLADPSLQFAQDGRLLTGGAPLRFLRLSEAGARLVRSWLDGTPVGPGTGVQKLARRLVEAGMAHPDPPPVEPGAEADLTVIIPVRDDQEGLEATLGALAPMPDLAVIVVDDASIRPVVLPLAGPARWRLVRRAAPGGPGTARQSGLALATTGLVAFIDAGVVLAAEDVRALGRWFDDPGMVAVGPRVATAAGSDLLTAYEADRSPLDLGPVPSPVGPGRRVAYLPSAALVARREVVEAVGGFDPGLRYGEDVDLVWRLRARGEVRYDPSVRAAHPARGTLAAFARQRRGYGSAAAPLASRHGSQVAPARLSGWSLACWALVLARRPGAALVMAGGTALALDRKLARVMGGDGPGQGRAASARLAFQGHWAAGGALADAAARDWWPATAAVALVGRRRPMVGLVLWAALRRVRSSQGPLPHRALDLGLGIVDNLAYGAGVWRGAWHQRSLRCLLPNLTSWPGRTKGRP